MTTEFMRYEGHRFLLYKRWDYAPHGRTEEQTEALEAGKALFKAANFEHWASQPKLVERIQDFLVSSIPSYRPNPYGETPRNIVNALCWELRNGTALIVRAKPAYIAHNGFVPARTEEQKYQAELVDRAERSRLYEARSKAQDDDFRAYNQRMDERAVSATSELKPFRHIETIAEAAVRNRAAWAGGDALAALASAVASVVVSSLPSMDDDAFDLGEVSEVDTASTPLGDAAPFEYGDMPSFGDSFDIAKTPNYGDPGTWYTNPGSGQMRLYGDTGAPVVDFDFDHDHGQGIPHAHNYGPVGADGVFNREGGRSFSLLPW
jgi:hypothetical protein